MRYLKNIVKKSSGNLSIANKVVTSNQDKDIEAEKLDYVVLTI